MWRKFPFLALVYFVGCSAVLPASKHVVGEYQQEGVWYVFRHELTVREDGTFKMTMIANLFDPVDQEVSDRWTNEISGRWARDDGFLTLHPDKERDDNPSSKIGLSELRFRVEGRGRDVLLIGGEPEKGLRFRK